MEVLNKRPSSVPSRSEEETAGPGATQELLLLIGGPRRIAKQAVRATWMCTAITTQIMPTFMSDLLIRQTTAVVTNTSARIGKPEARREMVDGPREGRHRQYTTGSGEPKIAEENS